MSQLTLIDNPPVWSNGSPGDRAGMMVLLSAGVIVYCFKDYSDGNSPIWASTSFTNGNGPSLPQNPATLPTVVRVSVKIQQGRTGQERSINWIAQNTSSLTLNGVTTNLRGTMKVNDHRTQTYTFIATGPMGIDTKVVGPFWNNKGPRL